MNPRVRLLPILFVFAFICASTGAPTIETGEIDGAKFSLAKPAKWNRHVLLLAHGLRAEGKPLVADLFPEHLAYKTLIDEGWIVAKTSYRRNGIIVADAIRDLDALRAHIARTHGRPERILLEGDSMGGLIVTLMAERPRGLYAGAVAIGAALSVQDPNATVGVSLQPKIPVIFLTNQNELEGPKAYVNSPVPREDDTIPPVLLRVSREGHVEVNQRERLVALRALNAWLDRGSSALPRPPPGQPFADVTVVPDVQPSQVAFHPDRRGFDVRVIEISAIYGNVFLAAQPSDFAAIGLVPMSWFQTRVGEKSYRVRYGRHFNSVKRGEWVAFPNADGFTWLARNYADAAATAGVNVGDSVSIRRYDSGEADP